MKTLTVKLPPDLNARLDGAARQRGQTKSELVREALEALLSSPSGRPPANSARELAGDLVGCIEGPRDLSTNATYMNGFGE